MRFRLSILGVVGGAAAGGGAVGLLQQSAVLYPEVPVLGAAVGAGALAGLLLPTVARPGRGARRVAVPLEGVRDPEVPPADGGAGEATRIGDDAATSRAGTDDAASPISGPAVPEERPAAPSAAGTSDTTETIGLASAVDPLPEEQATGDDDVPEPGVDPHEEPASADGTDATAAAWSADGGSWRPTHLVPPQGMAAWAAPDPALAPVAQLAGGVELVVEETAGAWAHVRGSNGWQGWVDGRILVPPTA